LQLAFRSKGIDCCRRLFFHSAGAASVNLEELIVPTAVAEPGMTVEALFRECIAKQVPGLPFRDKHGKLSGKASIRHVLKLSCIPDYMVKHAALLGDHLESLTIPALKAKRMLSLTVDSFILDDLPLVGRQSPVTKALAVMERHDTTYVFVADGDDYAGCVSIMGIAATVIAYAGS
jgi:hypothetical protein